MLYSHFHKKGSNEVFDIVTEYSKGQIVLASFFDISLRLDKSRNIFKIAILTPFCGCVQDPRSIFMGGDTLFVDGGSRDDRSQLEFIPRGKIMRIATSGRVSDSFLSFHARSAP